MTHGCQRLGAHVRWSARITRNSQGRTVVCRVQVLEDDLAQHDEGRSSGAHPRVHEPVLSDV